MFGKDDDDKNSRRAAKMGRCLSSKLSLLFRQLYCTKNSIINLFAVYESDIGDGQNWLLLNEHQALSSEAKGAEIKPLLVTKSVFGFAWRACIEH